MNQRIGTQSVRFGNPPVVLAEAAVVGPKEGEGPLGKDFDRIWPDEKDGAKTWEQAESCLQEQALRLALEKKKLSANDLHYLLAGDLINQITPSHFAARQAHIPFIGLYGACSTIGLGCSVGSMLIAGGYADCLGVEASSHYCTSEKQFRTPLGYGSQRPLYAGWTVTGAGALILGSGAPDLPPETIRVTGITTGKIVDYGVTDAFHMGGAMAPAAAALIKAHMRDFGVHPEEYDAVYTGDLGYYGSALLYELLEEDHLYLRGRHWDCGCMIFSKVEQDTHAGGSGCGCSAVTLAAHVLPRMRRGELRKVLFIPTGALLSPLSCQQGESIPGIAHGIVFEREDSRGRKGA